MDKTGRLIVIDGGDGSGKATQTKLLAERLESNNKTVVTFSFPRYAENMMGQLIGECQKGDHGDFVNLDPKIASVLYATDRYETKEKILNALAANDYVIMDRYVSANQIHQGGKIIDPDKQQEFLQWLEDLEHGLFGMPKPDIVFYLNVPVSVSRKLLQADNQRYKKLVYTAGKSDIVEDSTEYLENSRRQALEITKQFNNWQQIDCVVDNELLSIQEINDLLFAKI